MTYLFTDIWTQSPIWTSPNLNGAHEVSLVISQWLKECCTSPNHSNCRNKPPRIKSPLPSRIIDVGPRNGPRSPRLMMGQGRYGCYVALPHCWGSYQPFVTTRENLGQNLESIPMSSLPLTFRDAVQITRGLGLRYLWIDSLCIVQVDQKDWETESSNMIKIYQNATLPIVTASAEDSSQGRCISIQTDSLNLDISDPLLDTIHEEQQIIHVRKVPSESTLRRSILNGPLNQLAWVLQELLLSSRVVYFAQDQMYWQCANRLASEDGLLDEKFSVSRQIENGSLKLQARIFSLVGNLTSKIEWWSADVSRDFWWSVVEEYSTRILPKQSDRLPALAGLTEFFRLQLKKLLW
jgi:hypothetical protein